MGTVSAVKFGAFRFDRAAYRLERSGELLAMEPKALELLAILIEHRDRAVSRQELFDSLWPGQDVGDSSLSSLIYSLRQALGDSAGQKSFIRTVHRRGYQFIAEIDIESSPALSLQKKSSLTRYAGLAVLTFLLITGLVLWSPWSPKSYDFPGLHPVLARSDGPILIAMLPFADAEAPARDKLLDTSLAEALHMRLADVPGLQVRSPRVQANMLTDHPEPAHLLARAQVDFLLTGSLQASLSPNQRELNLELLEPFNGRVRTIPLGRYALPFPDQSDTFAEFMAQRDAILVRLLESLLPALNVDMTTDLIGTRHPDAFRLLMLALHEVRAVTCQIGPVEELLLRAVDIDPDFLHARLALAWIWYAHFRSCGLEQRYAEQASAELGLVLDRHPEHPVALLILALNEVEQGRVEAVYDRMSRVAANQPASPQLRYSLAYALTYAGFLDLAAEQLDQLIESDPLFISFEKALLPSAYLYRGQTERFLNTMPTMNTALFRFYRASAELQLGNVDEARSLLEPAFALNPLDIAAVMSEALLAAMDGDRASVEAILAGIDRRISKTHRPNGETLFQMARLLALVESDDRALALLEESIATGFFCRLCLTTDPVLTRLNDHPRWATVVKQARQRQQAMAKRFGIPIPPG
ncbi:MAG: hypothetical protein EA370_10805 [Wenzhouxiangella sp.]|nr:MAG: hypothetical protein EA370_10805 [Wenzhouxiangella sp.]